MAFALSARAPVAARASAARPAGAARRAVAPARKSGLAPSRFAAPAPALFTVEATKKSVGDLKKADLEGKVVLVSVGRARGCTEFVAEKGGREREGASRTGGGGSRLPCSREGRAGPRTALV